MKLNNIFLTFTAFAFFASVSAKEEAKNDKINEESSSSKKIRVFNLKMIFGCEKMKVLQKVTQEFSAKFEEHKQKAMQELQAEYEAYKAEYNVQAMQGIQQKYMNLEKEWSELKAKQVAILEQFQEAFEKFIEAVVEEICKAEGISVIHSKEGLFYPKNSNEVIDVSGKIMAKFDKTFEIKVYADKIKALTASLDPATKENITAAKKKAN